MTEMPRVVRISSPADVPRVVRIVQGLRGPPGPPFDTTYFNAVTEGMVGDAVQDDLTGAWTGTDQSAFLAALADQAIDDNKKIIIPRGDYMLNSAVFSLDRISNLDIEGHDERARFILGYTAGDTFAISGESDSSITSDISLAVEAPAMSRTITVDDASTLAVDQHIIIRAVGQSVYDHQGPASLVARLGEVNRIQAIAGNVVTLWAYTQFDYLAGTTYIRRFINPAVNNRFAGLTFEWDLTRTYAPAFACFQMRTTIGLRLEHLQFVNALSDQIVLSDSIDFEILHPRSLEPNSEDYFIYLRNACARGLVDHAYLRGGRHLITTGTVETQIEPAFVTVRHGEGHATSLTVFDTHPGSRNFVFDSCRATGGGDKGISTGSGEGAGFQMRGRDHTVINPFVSAYDKGVFMTGGENMRVIGGELRGCNTGISIAAAPNARVEGTRVIDPINLGVNIGDSADPAGGVLAGLNIRARVEGNPATAAVQLAAGELPDDWVIAVEAPDAAVHYSGEIQTQLNVPYEEGTISSGEYVLDPIEGNYQHYYNAGPHRLVPPGRPCTMMIECENIAGAGAIDTSLFNKVDGDTFSTVVGKHHQLRVERSNNVTRLTVSYVPYVTFLNAITGLGLTSGLVLCLDAGDSASWSGSGNWIDRSGGSPLNFVPGAGALSPTFNGTVGALTANEYFSFDGGDYFTYGGANEAWMQTLHKDNAIATWVFLAWMGATQTQALCGTDGGDPTKIGFEVQTNSSNALQFSARNGSTIAGTHGATNAGTGAWKFLGVAFDESVGAGGADFRSNGTTGSDASNWTSPSAASASYLLQIGAGGAGGRKLSNGSRLAGAMAWNVRLTSAQMKSLYNVLRTRFAI